MPNRKDWQPEDTQVETAAMALRAQQMRLWNLVEDSATVGRCWQQTPVWLRCEYRQMASAMLRAVHSHSPDSIRDKRPPSVRQLSEKAADEEEKRIKESVNLPRRRASRLGRECCSHDSALTCWGREVIMGAPSIMVG